MLTFAFIIMFFLTFMFINSGRLKEVIYIKPYKNDKQADCLKPDI